MKASPDEAALTPDVSITAPVAIESAEPMTRFANVSSAPNGYKVISQHPVPESVRKLAARPSSGVLLLLLGLVVSVCAFPIGLTAELATPLILAMTVAPTALGCFLSMKLEHTRKRTFSEDPTVLAIAAESGIPADEIAAGLYRVAISERNLPLSIRSHTKVFVNRQEFAEDTGRLIRVIPTDEQSIGLLQKAER